MLEFEFKLLLFGLQLGGPSPAKFGFAVRVEEGVMLFADLGQAGLQVVFRCCGGLHRAHQWCSFLVVWAKLSAR